MISLLIPLGPNAPESKSNGLEIPELFRSKEAARGSLVAKTMYRVANMVKQTTIAPDARRFFHVPLYMPARSVSATSHRIHLINHLILSDPRPRPSSV
ncbi:unnamed protein product [Fusarium graminearum]|uniref:Chromosome 1, complete genome n=1 Tax=Gibberella zeae (strain ATCC MYA-4620 / CBS 123657 / FGSC 9075 / NRRL 31084 / PH-1) TaxID=229533 RepID=A0A098D219_GIBZE|nr:unnamed protein product [Fusarium graminearum]CZS75754.1 unnamed protein product [Fusarium graminearum]